MRFASLFTGIGGFDLGFERAGMECYLQVEINKDCQRVLARHFPAVERFEDVTTIRGIPRVDVLCGGFPCQDLSVAGKRKGLAGERSGLWYEFLRIARANQPRYVVIENVPGLLSSDGYRDFAVIIRGLVECGYCVAWRVLDAQFYGVAQRRRRLFIVGSLGDGSCAEILFERESVSWNPPTRGEARPRVAASVKASAPNRRNGGSDPIGDEFVIAATLDQRGRGPTDAVMMNLQVARPLANSRTIDHYDESQQTYIYHENIDGKVYGSPESPALRDFQKDAPMIISVPTAYRTAGNCGPFEQGDKTAALNTATDPNQNIIAFSSKDHGADAGQVSPTLRSMNSDNSHQNGGGQVAIAFQSNESFNSGASEILAPTLRVGSNGAGQPPAIAFDERNITSRENRSNPQPGDPCHTLHSDAPRLASGFGVRRLTPCECERLQSFPDDWTLYDADGKEISDSARYRMLGNAVCVNVAEWIGKRILMQK